MSELPRQRVSRFSSQEEEQPLKVPKLDEESDIKKALAEKIAKLKANISSSSSIPAKNAISTSLPPGLSPHENLKPVRLDSQGRKIDEFGNVILPDLSNIKTLAINKNYNDAIQPEVKIEKKKVEKINPYLSHKYESSNEIIDQVPGLNSTQASEDKEESKEILYFDERIPTKRRDLRLKKSLHFIQEGTYIEKEKELQIKEEKKKIAGYSSGRKAITNEENVKEEEELEQEVEEESIPALNINKVNIEWWDEPYLPKKKENSPDQALSDLSLYKSCNLKNSKTFSYIQHPPIIRALGTSISNSDEPKVLKIPTYLTKKEQKKLRKATRMEKEKEKREKQMLGLIEAPAPKVTLNNFIKIFNIENVIDPTEIEKKIVKQIQKRKIDHELNNLKNKLTKEERKLKKLKKLTNEVANNNNNGSISVNLYCVTSLLCEKYQFKIDLTAQQLLISGIIIISPIKDYNLIYVEGSNNSLRKFKNLLLNRIRWDLHYPSKKLFLQKKMEEQEKQNKIEVEEGINNDDYDQSQPQETISPDNMDNEDDSDDSDLSDDEDDKNINLNSNDPDTPYKVDRRCDLLWTGIIPKRVFHTLKFHQVNDLASGKKLLESKNIGFYWDMMVNFNKEKKDASHIDDFF